MAESTLLKSANTAPTFEGKPIVLNPDGSWSHERAIGVELGGKHMNIPTMFGGKQVSPQTAIEILRKNKWVDPDNGQPIKTFDSRGDADAAAKAKEKAQQAVTFTDEQLKILREKAKEQQPQASNKPARSASSLLAETFQRMSGNVQ